GLKWRQAVRYVARAREAMRDSLDETEHDLRVQSYRRYLAIATDTSVPPQFRIKAQERIDVLLGLEGPRKLEVTANNKPADPDAVDRAVNRFYELVGLPRPQLPEPVEAEIVCGNGSRELLGS